MARVITANGSVHLDTCGLVRGDVKPTRKPLTCKRDIARMEDATVTNTVRTTGNGIKVAVVTQDKPKKAPKKAVKATEPSKTPKGTRKAAKVAHAAANNTSKNTVVVIDGEAPSKTRKRRSNQGVTSVITSDYTVSAVMGLDALLLAAVTSLGGALDMMEAAPDAPFNEGHATLLREMAETVQKMRTDRKR